MMRMSGKMKLGLVAGSVFGLALAIVVNYSSACRLREVTLDDAPVKDWSTRFGHLDSLGGPSQSLEASAQQLLADSNIFRVDLSWALPHRLDIRTNHFAPACFLLDDATDRLLGVDDDGRVVPLSAPVETWERPVLTGLAVTRLFEHCRDNRVEVVVKRLRRLQHDNRDLYRLIEEIDFSEPFGLIITVAGLPYRIKVRAEALPENMDLFAQFVTRYGIDLTEANLLDLRFGDMVFCTRGKN
jgi:hypothetical protein